MDQILTGTLMGMTSQSQMDQETQWANWVFCLSGAIGGFSRRVIYLKVGQTNHGPQVIARYYLDAGEKIGGCPQILQTDCGTENVTIAALQTLFCEVSDSGIDASKCHRYSSSQNNQRIECWWSSFRKSRSEWWITKFQQLTENGFFNAGNIIQKWCLQFF